MELNIFIYICIVCFSSQQKLKEAEQEKQNLLKRLNEKDKKVEGWFLLCSWILQYIQRK